MSSVDHDPDRHPDIDSLLPEGWSSTRVGDIADSLTYGYTASAAAGSHGPRFLRITDIQNGKVDWNSVPTCTIEERDIRKYGLTPGDIVFARTGATTGKSFLIKSCPLAVFASYLIRLRLLPGINPVVLEYFFQTPEYWSFISDNVAGIAQPNCNATKLSELQVPMPPSGEQQRLVEAVETALSKVDAARDHLSRVPAILKRFRQAVLSAACSGRLTEDAGLANSWTETKLGDLALEIRTGPFGSALHKSDYVQGGIPVINPTNIVDGKIVPNEHVSLSKATFRRLEEYALRQGDIIIARRGEMGRCAVVGSRRGGLAVRHRISTTQIEEDGHTSLRANVPFLSRRTSVSK